MTRHPATANDETQARAAAETELDDALLDRALDGHGLAAAGASAPTLRELSSRGPLLLVFLRHYG